MHLGCGTRFEIPCREGIVDGLIEEEYNGVDVIQGYDLMEELQCMVTESARACGYYSASAGINLGTPGCTIFGSTIFGGTSLAAPPY